MATNRTWKQNLIRHAKRMAIRCFKCVYLVMQKTVSVDDKTVILLPFMVAAIPIIPNIFIKKCCDKLVLMTIRWCGQ